jgi:tetratricopeptide (TPR) repeat protein
MIKRILLFLVLLSISTAQAQLNIDSLLKVIESTVPSKKKIELHFEASEYYKKSLENSKGFLQLDKADQLAKSLKLSNRLAWSYYQRGRFHSYINESTLAIDWFRKALHLKNGLTPWERISVSNSIGIVFLHYSEYRKAVSVYRKAIDDINKNEDLKPEDFVLIYNNIGYTYSQIEEPDSSMYFHLICKSIREAKKDSLGLG